MKLTNLGVGFLVVLLVALAVASNEDKSFAYLLVFLLLSLFVVSLVRGGLALGSLRLVRLDAESTFANRRPVVRGLLSLGGHPSPASLQLSCAAGSGLARGAVTGADGGFELRLPRQPRGRLRLESLRVSSRFPAGLLSWSVRFDGLAVTALIYPAPLDRLAKLNPDGCSRGLSVSGEFDELRPLQQGEPLSGLCWKTYARTGKRMRKHFLAVDAERDLSFDWEQLPQLTDELRRSQLCYWVVQGHRDQARYGLRLPHVAIEPSFGAQHYQRCLAALAED